MQTNFETLVNQEVLIISNALTDGAGPVTIRGVDAGGIWVECQEITDAFLKQLGKTMFEGTPITYIPFWRISLAAIGKAIPSISSESVSP